MDDKSDKMEKTGQARTPPPVAGDAPPVEPAGEVPVGSDAPPPEKPATGRKHKFSIPNASPDRPWWMRHAKLLLLFEWVVAALLIVVAFYYLWFLVFPREVAVVRDEPPPTVEEFRARVREYPAMAPAGEWKVAKLSPRWKRIIIHHSATDRGSAESFDRVHREERKWENGLGYHFVIGNGNGMGDGEVAVGKRWLEQLDGAHIKGEKGVNLNSQSIGIALVGNFENYLPTAKQLAALKGLLNFLRAECSISLGNITGHKDLSSNKTLCPGHHFYLDELKLSLANP